MPTGIRRRNAGRTAYRRRAFFDGAEINKHNLQGRIILTGFQKNPLDFVQTFNIYLITSLYEGMPYSVLEALNFGLPLVATNVIGNNEVVENGYNGFLFEKKKVHDGVQKNSRSYE
ncbi:glycosyltransferase [Paenibacillus sp. P22]|uniref:glycosyltransferase n=1 Tax=Paenibacillus sp. P22 TaxID=483908 RepID=UPI0004319A6E|nr:glycosyltransferase [Paenibacillus sp. P22]CDN41880.1 hypothetical protein BN871_AO_00020 [Paenibacillus sp. P22]